MSSSPEPFEGLAAVDGRLISTPLPSDRSVTAASERDEGSREVSAAHTVAAAYEDHAEALGRLAYLLTGDAALAEDLVQEAFVRAFARFVHLRRPEAMGAYLRRSVVNLARKQFRRRENERTRAISGAGHEVRAQPDVELREQLWAALRQLPYRQQAALVLRFYEDKSEREVARDLGCRVGTVKSLVHRGSGHCESR
jgi:RNA polymerase sigma-70 factor (sigma-E family)